MCLNGCKCRAWRTGFAMPGCCTHTRTRTRGSSSSGPARCLPASRPVLVHRGHDVCVRVCVCVRACIACVRACRPCAELAEPSATRGPPRLVLRCRCRSRALQRHRAHRWPRWPPPRRPSRPVWPPWAWASPCARCPARRPRIGDWLAGAGRQAGRAAGRQGQQACRQRQLWRWRPAARVPRLAALCCTAWRVGYTACQAGCWVRHGWMLVQAEAGVGAQPPAPPPHAQAQPPPSLPPRAHRSPGWGLGR